MKTTKFITSVGLAIVLSTVITGCSNGQSKQATSANVQKVSVDTFEALAQKGAIILDVRTPEEYASGHIENAKNINFLDAEFKQKVATFKEENQVLVYCRSGGRSGRASQVLSEVGFKEVMDLNGGIIAWEKAGNKIIK